TTRYTYDAVGNATSVVDPRGHTTSYTYNQLDEVVRETSRADANGVRYTYDTYYDADGRVVVRDVSNVDDSGNVPSNSRFTTQYSYDAQGRTTLVIREVDASHSVVTEYQYDGNRNRTLI